MDRRTLLKYSFALSTMGTLSAALQARAEASGDPSQWGYVGADAPEHWSELSTDYGACSTGAAQSPIDLQRSAELSQAQPLEIDYQGTPLKILHNGHNVQVNYGVGSSLKLDNRDYELLQFHFHEPSEHTLDGLPLAMEMHLVHKNQATQGLAVLAVFIKAGQENQALKSIWQHMPSQKTPETTVPDTIINISQLLPSDLSQFYRYQGSLTTPPCSEGVEWIVLEEAIEASPQQIKQFVNAVGENARPVQLLNRRALRLEDTD